MTRPQLATVYDASYTCGGLGHFDRLGILAEAAKSRVGLRWLGRAMNPLSDAALLILLRKLHSQDYVNAFLTGEPVIARSNYLPWSEALRDGVLAMMAGQLFAAEIAMSEAVVMHLAFGFHHAHPARGGGFCTFNGLALVALANPHLKIAVLDCDEHGADGTEAFAEQLGNLTSYSIFGTRFGLRGHARSRLFQVPRGADSRAAFRTALQQSLEEIHQQAPDLLLYQAGADAHVLDPRSSLALESEDLVWRDHCVFEFCRNNNTPVLANLAGAYQAPELSSALYLQTIDAALASRQRSLT